ncbi:1-deoxy-D-xylulose-5-phosphate reductoisomerase [Gynuella sp.]|uniref:1-deoxy-D-xylulose-5-phosphate reductoisomerase n=1 Tax=Gynuella sp. TaxID=2969146 RepID=UPI003D0BE1A2
MQNLTVLGSTGSVGCSTLDVVRRNLDCYKVFALSGYKNVELLAQQIVEFNPDVAVVGDEMDLVRLKALLPVRHSCELLCGKQALVDIAQADKADIVMAAIVGAAGLEPSLAAARAGKKLLLANKESLVTSGQLFMAAVKQSDTLLLPIDSEHNAIFQCLPNQFDISDPSQGVRSILLTASGGPFRAWTMEQITNASREQALAHPNWSMGAKITIDSATLMNKGLELIEACWLFSVSPEQVEVVVHPQSIIHSMVRYRDGSVLAQMGAPDMKIPIAYGLGWPERIDSGASALDFLSLSSLTFEAPDEIRFPCIRLAREAFSAGGTAGSVLNAANEVAVDAFLNGKIGFTKIAYVNELILNQIPVSTLDSIETVLEFDALARSQAERAVNQIAGGLS